MVIRCPYEFDPYFWIYRVYGFDRNTMSGMVEKMKGSFSDFFEPHTYLFYGSYGGAAGARKADSKKR